MGIRSVFLCVVFFAFQRMRRTIYPTFQTERSVRLAGVGQQKGCLLKAPCNVSLSAMSCLDFKEVKFTILRGNRGINIEMM